MNGLKIPKVEDLSLKQKVVVVILHKSVQVIRNELLYSVKLHKSEVLFLCFVIMNLELLELVFVDFRAY
jgi:hypothetical protein